MKELNCGIDGEIRAGLENLCAIFAKLREDLRMFTGDFRGITCEFSDGYFDLIFHPYLFAISAGLLANFVSLFAIFGSLFAN